MIQDIEISVSETSATEVYSWCAGFVENSPFVTWSSSLWGHFMYIGIVYSDFWKSYPLLS